jgi:hypothetical protein
MLSEGRPPDLAHTTVDDRCGIRSETSEFAEVAELADAQGLGPCVQKDVQVQVLSSALT